MSTALFPAAAAYYGDPIRPDTETVTPAEIVANLSATDQAKRLDALREQAHQIVIDANAQHGRERDITARCVLFSGGGDSLTIAHLFRDTATHAVHANTGIGIEETREFVRATCTAWGLPLIEKHTPDSYRDLVIERGFPGPAMHFKMYSRLKERALDLVRHDLGIANSRTKAAIWIAGRRREESQRRADIPLHESDGSVIWASPIAMWTKLDVTRYLHANDVATNPVPGVLHMSGECLCGAYAHPGELEEIGHWYPDAAAVIHDLEAEVIAAGIAEPFCRWGHGQGKPSTDVGRLCSSCSIPGQAAFDLDGMTE